MLKDLVGKDVVVTVSFSLGEAGSSEYIGKILDIEDDFIKLDVNKVRNVGIMHAELSLSGICTLNKNYIVSIFEK